ncbi:hypothetical protein SAY86_007594 [Trapa natans]|uniref:Uncharacterized protein n=1 Tax=Trapa natans TaxID=22666 RepID=A0AAN7LLP3_TRANT|nr:hypothetical protein SAY86_007594 [Trapa natans]
MPISSSITLLNQRSLLSSANSLVALLVIASLSLAAAMPAVPSFNLSSSTAEPSSGWFRAGATWYGPPNGSGSDVFINKDDDCISSRVCFSQGGACGYGGDVGKPPFSSMVSAGGPSLFDSGKGCGACYEVKCTTNAACSGKQVRVVITDNCPGGPCVEGPAHFDLSGTAFGAMAKAKQGDQLRNVGVLQIFYRKVECHYPGDKVTFKVDPGSNPYYLAILIEYLEGEANINFVEVSDSGSRSGSWLLMQRSWGTIWQVNAGSPLQGPVSIRITVGDQLKRVLVAKNALPKDWQPGGLYKSSVTYQL